ncbi:MAG: glutamine-hydrolyzing carbamoyl-phosphate synthase small subunit [Acidimicrobiia bacterium]|nr:glutamine-hydrolyzing carbamoyl-phosphate synthase small subunit [Acidimicrobiia bacterium]
MTAGALVLADGETFAGTLVGATDAIATGEVVFNTAMTGYQEIATDPSYAGQIVTMTVPHIGNYGTNHGDDQSSRAWCTGFVTRSLSRRESSWRSEGSFSAWLRDRGVVGLTDVDTRRLTRHLRDRGAMPGAVGTAAVAELQAAAHAAPEMDGRDLTGMVTTSAPYRESPVGDARGRVVAIDFGMKRDLVTALTGRRLEVHVVPSDTRAEDVLALDPTGVFLSNGPGDPEPVAAARATVRGLLGHVPMFGVCLGHQILGLALGATTFKLPFGHHGGNHPVRRLDDGRVTITAQNHGFAVDLWSLAGTEPPAGSGLPGPELLPESIDTAFGTVIPTHQNLNDGTLEGLAAPDARAFSVQYHPEAAPGPNDAAGLFDRFLELMEVS